MSAHDDVIYLVAPTGHPNFGDEYIAAAWLRTLARRRPRSRVVLDCPNPGVASILHAGLHSRLTVTDTLFRLAEAARAGTPEGPGHWAAAARRAEEFAVDEELLDATAPHLAPGLSLLRGASVVHALGGGWINGIWPDKSVVMAAASAVAAASAAASVVEGRRVRLVATGMGLAPVRVGDAGDADELDGTMSRIWSRFDAIDVRDAPSESIVRDAIAQVAGTHDPAPEVTFSGDDAWVVLGGGDLEDNGLGLGRGRGPGNVPGHVLGDGPGHVPGPERDPGSDPADRPIMLCLQGDLLAADGEADDAAADGAPDPIIRLADAVIAALRSWTVDGRPVSGGDVGVVEAIPSVDKRVWRAIADRAPDLAEGARTVRFAELWDAGLPARPGQTWLTTRFHPHLIAAARGARGVALDVHVGGYYSVKHASVVAAGSRWPVVSLDDVASTPPGPGIPEDVATANRRAKAEVVELIYPMGAVMEGAVTAAVKGRAALREVRGVVDKLAGTSEE